ncbi:MAG: hypothetical protein NC309_08720 [Ruminococcus sp.]|nr:hypothetical protein [Ruminococcus sp.]
MMVKLSNVNSVDGLKECIEQAKMNEQMPADGQLTTNKYQTFKAELDKELNKAADGFVKIGYLLKKARDTDVLEESGYKTVTEFAKMEYGLTADVVSRYIAINDRFAEDGYSDRLASKYCSYGLAKLQEMLTLPLPIVDELSPELTREEIQTIKKEYREEQEISDLEVIMEAADEETKQTATRQQEENSKEAAGQTGNGINTRPDGDFEPKNNLEKMMYAYFEEYPDEYIRARTVDKGGLMELLAPSGYRVITNRIAGQGKIMLTMMTDGITLVNMRSGEKEKYTWTDANFLFDEERWGYELSYDYDIDAEHAKKRWEGLYKKPFPDIKEAPDQQTDASSPKQARDKHKKKENKVTVIKPKKEAEEKTEEPKLEESIQEENLRVTVEDTTADKSEADNNKATEADNTQEASDNSTPAENEKIAPVQKYSDVKYKVQLNEFAKQVYGTSEKLQEMSVSDNHIKNHKI